MCQKRLFPAERGGAVSIIQKSVEEEVVFVIIQSPRSSYTGAASLATGGAAWPAGTYLLHRSRGTARRQAAAPHQQRGEEEEQVVSATISVTIKEQPQVARHPQTQQRRSRSSEQDRTPALRRRQSNDVDAFAQVPAVGGSAVELIRDRRFDLCVHRGGDLSDTIQTVVDLGVRVRETACPAGTTAPPVRPCARPIRIHGRASRAQSREGRPARWQPPGDNVSGCEHRDGNIIYAQRAPRPT